MGTNLSEILIEIYWFSFKETHLKMSPGKWRPFNLSDDDDNTDDDNNNNNNDNDINNMNNINNNDNDDNNTNNNNNNIKTTTINYLWKIPVQIYMYRHLAQKWFI